MKRISLSLLSLFAAVFIIPSAHAASDLMVASTMQRCTANEDCALVTQSCADNCAFVPVNKSNMPALDAQYQQRCGKPASANPTCNMNPPIAAACVNARCSIDYAYKNNASAGDYKSGAYGVSEQAVPSKVQGDYSKVNDKGTGFSAYNLPQGEVKQNTVGTITTKIYVPPSAPVSGGNYVPVTPTASAPAANIPPAAVPTQNTQATPPAVVPQRAPMSAPAPAPSAMPVPRAPTSSGPYECVPGPAAAAPVPAAPVPSVGATGVPIAPPSSVPIPPSDVKPQPQLVPPAGATVPVGPNDPGAIPPGADLMQMPETLPAGSKAMPLPPTGTVAEAQKSFSGLNKKTSKYITSTSTNE